MKRLHWNKHLRLVLKHLLGWICIVLGIVMLVMPGQGILTLLAGIYLLADEVPMFGRIKAWLQHRFPKAAAVAERMKERFHKKTTEHTDPCEREERMSNNEHGISNNEQKKIG